MQPSPHHSERILPTESFIYRHQNNLEIQPEGPVLDIPQVVFNAFLHFFQGICFSAPAVGLGPACDAGFDLVAHHVAEDLFSVEFIVGYGVGSGSHNGHSPLQHINKLREFVQGGAPQECSQLCDPGVIFASLGNGITVFADTHGAEFPDHDFFPIHAVTVLLEQDRSLGCQLYQQGDAAHRQGNQGQNEDGKNDILDFFGQAIAARGVAVGMPVTRHPPHRSVREVLPHTAPTSGNYAKISGLEGAQL